MARVRQFNDSTDIAAPAAPAASTSPMGAWPFAPVEGASAKPPVEAPAAEQPPVAEDAAQAKATKARAPKAAVAAPVVAPKELPSVLGLVIDDLTAAARLVESADKKHIPSALDELEMRIKVVRAILGS